MNSLQILSFVGFTLLVAVITWWKVRKTDTGSQQGYFLAGRSLKAPVIAASLMLTNLSTEQLVGLSGQAYKSGMSVMGWEVTSAVTLIFLALIFLPRYLKRGIATIPDFLEERYDKTTRIIIDFCFLIATGVCFLPIVLYSGALALNSLFHVGESLQISHGAAIWLLVILLGLAGILYAVIGGLRAMAVADSINGIGLVIGGLMVPVFGLIAMGKGSFMQGIEQLTTVHAEKLNSIGGPTDPLPIGAAFTGLILVNTFYWCTNQGIVQRTLASKSLAEGQKGALLTAVLKMLDPLVLVLPGLIAFHLYQDLPKADMAYPTLVNNVLPVPMVGFFGAVLFGAVISTFNGFLNSASTLFSMGIYRRIINQNAEPQQLVTVGRKFGFFIAIVSVLVAPWIANAPQGLYSWMKQLNGIYNVPLVTIIIMGFFFPRIPALAAKVAMGIGIISYITINYLVKFDFHFLYVLACTFCINVVVMLVIGFIKPRATPFTFKDAFAVDMKPWRNVKIASPGKNISTMGRYFKDAGYHTCYIGKWHLDGHDYFGTGECPPEWDADYWFDGANYLSELTEKEISLWRNGLNSVEDLQANHIDETFTWAHRISNRAVDFLQQPARAEEPFLMVVSYDEPHHPFTCPVEYLEKYADFYYDLGEKAQDDLANKPEHHRLWAQAMPSPVGDDGLYHHPLYFACNDFVDDQIGRVINALTPEQRENTWVIYTSDHGEMMGAHKLISKGAAMYDDITRIPLIIRSPQGERRQVDTPVSHIDLLPTMMALADIEKPEILPGENILAVKEPRGVMVEFNRYEIEHDSFGGFIPVRCWVTDDFKLVLNLFTSDELYDRRNDPNEMHNLIDDIRFADVRSKMHDALLDYMDKIRDPFRSYQWSLRPWRKDALPRWMGAFRPRPQDGYSPVVRDYDTGLPTQGVKVEEKKQKF